MTPAGVVAEFRPHPSAVSAARGFLRSALSDLGLTETSGDLIDLLVMTANELATNAVLHARTEFTIRVLADPTRVRMEVSDATPGCRSPPGTRARDLGSRPGHHRRQRAAMAARGAGPQCGSAPVRGARARSMIDLGRADDTERQRQAFGEMRARSSLRVFGGPGAQVFTVRGTHKPPPETRRPERGLAVG